MTSSPSSSPPSEVARGCRRVPPRGRRRSPRSPRRPRRACSAARRTSGRSARRRAGSRRPGRAPLHHVLGRVDDTVQHGPAHTLREQVGVHAAELGAVRDPEVVQLVVAEDLPHQVQVAGGLGGADVRQDVAGVLLARRGDQLVQLDQRVGLVAAVVGRLVHLLLGLLGRLGVQAAHAAAVADAARVEAHQVVAGAQFLVVGGEGGQRGHAGAARAAEVEEQRTEPVVRVAAGAGPDQCDADGLPAGLLPVQRGPHGGALPAGAVRERGGGLAAALDGARGGAVPPVQGLLPQAVLVGSVARRRGAVGSPAGVPFRRRAGRQGAGEQGRGGQQGSGGYQACCGHALRLRRAGRGRAVRRPFGASGPRPVTGRGPVR